MTRKLIDFDQNFSDYLGNWMQNHQKEYHNLEEMEADMPNVYERFLSLPAAWLDGQKPGEYFDQFDNAQELVSWMCEYVKSKIPVPDQLMNRIADLGEKAVPALMDVLTSDDASREDKMNAVGLLREIDSPAPMQLYVSWQQNREEEDELADNAMDSLAFMGEEATRALRAAFESANDCGREAMLDVLCRTTGDEVVFQDTLSRFCANKEKRALLAGYLARLMDERALPALLSAAKEESLPYLDYIEIRSAIEALGGEAPEREYESDAAYEAMKAIENQSYKGEQE